MDWKKFKGIIFDLDGTLVESNYVWSDIDREFLGKRGIEVPEDYFKIVSTMNFSEAAAYTNNRFSLNENPVDIETEWYEMAVYHYSHSIGLVDGAKAFLEYLKKNRFKISLATASSRELFEPVLKNNGIYDYFDFFATTKEVSRGKGFPDVYELAAEKTGCKPCECVVFEDIIEGIRGAKTGGFTAVACLNNCYKADWNKLKQEADLSFHSYNELT